LAVAQVDRKQASGLGALAAAITITIAVVLFGAWQAQTLPLGDTKPPAKVTGLVIDSVGGGRLLLTWEEPYDDYGVSFYIIRRDGAALEDEPTFTHYLDAGLQVGRTYTYQVLAVDLGGNEGPLSEAVSATPEP
jgi:hypothetical protein